jgi:hypothetical protein
LKTAWERGKTVSDGTGEGCGEVADRE